jgi:DNA adenine methylase
LKANQKEVNFHHASFTESLSNVPDGSHLYVDPPYSPLPAQKTNFTQYYDEKFEHDEHDLLATILFDLAEKGHHIILSDHDTPQVRARYKGCFIHTFQAQRSISASATKRTFANELIINVKHTHL